ncbi:MAG: hypothetical protein AB7S78_09040 [Candidatus Omnitrophota bacterium]
MKKKILFIMFTAMFLAANNALAKKPVEMKEERKAFKETQKMENKEFREKMKDMEPEVRKAAMKEHKGEQKSENREFREEQFQERINKIKNNDKLTEDQKAERIKKIKEERDEARAHFQSQQDENKAFLDGLSPDLTKEERNAAIKAHKEMQKKENMEFRNGRKEDHKAWLGERKSK